MDAFEYQQNLLHDLKERLAHIEQEILNGGIADFVKYKALTERRWEMIETMELVKTVYTRAFKEEENDD